MNVPAYHTDAQLLTALRNADHAAFETIYRRYVPEIYRYLRKNIYNKEDCEEIIQEIFESLWVRRSHLEIKSSIAAYLVGMARYKIIGYFRKNAMVKKYRDHFLLFEAVYEQTENAGVNYAAVQATLARLMAELPERCQEALRLRLSEELSNGDIAKRMNISTRTVESYMFRAFNHIRDSYRQYVSQAYFISLLLSAIFGGN